MPWNQPGSNGDKDPWGHNNGRQDGPPDLDEMFKDVKNRLDGLFGGKKGGGGDNAGSAPSGPGVGLVGLIVVVALIAWGATGIYTVVQGEQAIELMFGKYGETKGAGLRWHWPTPIESVEIVNTEQVNTVEVGYRSRGGRANSSVPHEALMLTEDENIIDVHFAVQYDVKDPTQLLFQVSEYNTRDLADTVVRQATESAVREIVGRSTMDFAITGGRAQLAAETKSLLQSILDRYDTGINIRSVEMQNAQPPAQVKAAFDDVVKAREDEERLKNLAEAYANDIIPRARGLAARYVQEAEAYKASTVARAEGEASRFDQVLKEYSKAPEITRDRLYLESMEQVLSNSSKMIIDQDGGNSVMYLPLDQMIRNRSSGQSGANNTSLPSSSSISSSAQGSQFGGRESDRMAQRGGRTIR